MEFDSREFWDEEDERREKDLTWEDIADMNDRDLVKFLDRKAEMLLYRMMDMAILKGDIIKSKEAKTLSSRLENISTAIFRDSRPFEELAKELEQIERQIKKSTKLTPDERRFLELKLKMVKTELGAFNVDSFRCYLLRKYKKKQSRKRGRSRKGRKRRKK